MKKKYIVGISCIGSGVGQSVINSCRLSGLPIRTIGFGTNPFAYGAYDCDTFDYTPNIYAEDYIYELIRKCKKHSVDLLIPGRDDEVLVIARNSKKFHESGIKVIVPGEELINICRDKERMSHELNQIADVFVKCYDKKTLNTDLARGKIKFPFIAKLKSGFASRGVEIIRSEADLCKIGDEHIVQELAIPVRQDPNYDYYMDELSKNLNAQVSEISIQIVTDQHGVLIGRMASYNKLQNGVPIEIVPFDNAQVWKVVDRLMPRLRELGLRGPLNLQGRITETGFKLFEMNARFTGITGLRALMGFNEVEACIKRWLEIDDGDCILQFNDRCFGVRQTADKAIPIERNDKVHDLYLKVNDGNIKKEKTLLITGASGYLGRNFVEAVIKDKKYKILVFSRKKDKMQELFHSLDVRYFDKADFESGILALGNVDILLSLELDSPYCTYEQIAGSLLLTGELFTRAAMNHVPAIINISSQSVYGMEREPLWDENTPVSCQSAYAQAQYASELILSSMARINNQVKATSLRLADIAGDQEGLVKEDVVSNFVEQALRGEVITIEGGAQQFERLDVRDAVTALIALVNTSPYKWKPVYNVGSVKTYNIKDLAALVVDIVHRHTGRMAPKIIIDPKDIRMKSGMDSSLFMKDTGWKPTFSMEDTIAHLVHHLSSNKESRKFNSGCQL